MSGPSHDECDLLSTELNRPVSIFAIVLVTLLCTALALAIGANLVTTEKRLLYRPRRLYTSVDADFRRALGILLGPPLLGGNRITSLVNGEQIYPVMIDAIPVRAPSPTPAADSM